MEWTRLTVHEAHKKLLEKSFSSLELTQSLYQWIKKVDCKVAAYLTLTEEKAYEQAQRADERIAKGEGVDELTGIPIALKDILCTKSTETTCASKILEHFRPPYDATVVRSLRDRGAVFLGKVNMDEFAMGSSTENSGFGITRNPWDFSRIPGGSSGGSAAAVAADECIASLGSDTGGSVRQPAACCGVVGMKPTYGRVSRFGLVAFASSVETGHITFYDEMALAAEFKGFYVCAARELNQLLQVKKTPDFTISHQHDLNTAELSQIMHWAPNTIGEIVFNFWD